VSGAGSKIVEKVMVSSV